MYINTKILKDYNITPLQLITMQIIKQLPFDKSIEEGDIRLLLDYLPPDEFITKIKGKAGQSELMKTRLSKKGKKVLELAQIPEITDGDVQMAEYLFKRYLSHEDEDRKIGNKKNVIKYCAIMRNYLSLSLKEFYYLCDEFLEDYQYTKVLEYVFFNKNKYRYGDFINHIEDSKLFSWYENNKPFLQKVWQRKIKSY